MFVNEAVAEYSEVEERDAIAGRALVIPELEERNIEMNPPAFLPTSSIVLLWVLYGLLPALLAALAAKGGLVLLLHGVAVADRAGQRASRLRVAWRSLVTWGAICALHIGAVAVAPAFGFELAAVLPIVAATILMIISCALPGRSLQDRIAGTWLVPR